jgi:CRP-like cAMP-binding protein
LASQSEVRTHTTKEAITEAGDTCRELLLLIDGDAKIYFYLNNQEVTVEKFQSGQTLNELEVLAHSDSKNIILADGYTSCVSRHFR